MSNSVQPRRRQPTKGVIVCCIQEICPFHLNCHFDVYKVGHSSPLLSFFVSVKSIVRALVSALILVIYIFSLFPLSIFLEVCQLYYPFQKNQLFLHWFSPILKYKFHWLLLFIISCFLLALDFFFNVFFNWRKVALQCCVGFFHTTV